MVISVTDEPLELVESWIAEVGATHPIVVMPEGQLEKVIGVEYFPTSAVFYGREMQWKGSAGEAASRLEPVQKMASKEPVYPKKLAKVIKSMKKGMPSNALQDLRKIAGKLEGRDASWAARLDAFLVESSAKAFAASAAAIEAGYWARGVELAQPYLGKSSPFPRAAETQAQLDMLKSEALYSKEMAGGALFQKAQDLEKAQEYLDAFKVYKSILKKSAGCKIAEHAQEAAQRLIEEGKPGFKPSCPNCRRNKGRACSKHLEKVKL